MSTVTASARSDPPALLRTGCVASSSAFCQGTRSPLTTSQIAKWPVAPLLLIRENVCCQGTWPWTTSQIRQVASCSLAPFHGSLIRGRACSGASEVDVSLLRVRVYQPHAEAVADVHALEPALEAALDGRVQDAHPRSFPRGARSRSRRTPGPRATRAAARRPPSSPGAPPCAPRLPSPCSALRARRVAVRCTAAWPPSMAALSRRCVTRSGNRRLGAVECV